jgi:hypothetical protein
VIWIIMATVYLPVWPDPYPGRGEVADIPNRKVTGLEWLSREVDELRRGEK